MPLAFCMIALAAHLAVSASALAAPQPTITHDPQHKQLTLSDASRHLVLHLSYDGKCLIDRVQVDGRDVVAPETGVCSAVLSGGTWSTTRSGIPTPAVTADDSTVHIAGILFGGPDMRVKEDWTFDLRNGDIRWTIDRTYLTAGTLQDTYFPGFEFAQISTWTGGLLDTGGVVWTRYLDTPLATYGAHTGAVTFWNSQSPTCLRISCVPASGDVAARFTHHPSGVFSASFWPSTDELQPAHGLARFLPDRQDLWKPVQVIPSSVRVMCTLSAVPYDAVRDPGTLKGLNAHTIRELLNTIGRYGVIDRGIVGSNGWRTGYVCLHEPWFAEMGLALNDPDYTRSFTLALDTIRDHAVTPQGRVLSRWTYNDQDAVPGSYDPATGFYECQWGCTLDSQPSYVMCVAEQFDLTGDLAWLRTHQDSCRAALDFLLRRDSDGDGLVEMMNDTYADEKSSDWIDVVWASHENALVNAELYGALTLWSTLETLMGDQARADSYASAARKLQLAFNKPVSEGGFWNPDKQWYIYWRQPDGSAHGDNLVVPVNFAALGYDLCTDDTRRTAVLDQVETLMQKEKLFHWPLCFFPYKPEEVHARQKQFPSYENGDIFLSWAELGIRAYARHNPAIALKYITLVLDRYAQDGLSFQRYLRADQRGEGEDILAGNSLAVVGLYRDIYGIRPAHDRLNLVPRITPELSGTTFPYRLRGQTYTVTLDADRASLSAEHATVTAPTPFGASISSAAACYFPFPDRPAALTLSTPPALPATRIEIAIDAWPDTPDGPRRWTLRAPQGAAAIHHTIDGLTPGSHLRLTREGQPPTDIAADENGRATFDIRDVTSTGTRVSLLGS